MLRRNEPLGTAVGEKVPDAGHKERLRVAYFASDATQGSVGKRIICFMDEGFDVTSFTFRKPRQAVTLQPVGPNVDLGEMPRRRYLYRLLHFFPVIRTLWRNRATLREAHVFYGRSLDSALLALISRNLLGSRAPLYYEIPDVREVLMSDGASGIVARWFERRVLNNVRRAIINSPFFRPEYLEKRQNFRGLSYPLENKIFARDLSAYEAARTAEPAPKAPNAMLTIAWFGNLDCNDTWRAIKRAASEFPDRVRFYMRGYVDVDQKDFEQALAASPNLVFEGPFNNRTDLASMYAQVDAVLGVDLMNKEGNTWWLLPNSLYEAGAFCTPLITTRGTATAARVAEAGLGWVLDEPFDDALTAFLHNFSWDEQRAIVKKMQESDPRAFAGQDQFHEMAELIRADVARA